MNDGRLKRLALCALLLGCVMPQGALAEGGAKPAPDASGASDSRWRGVFAFGFSRPLVMSLSLGTMLPLGHQDPLDPFPSSPALRVDGELGLGGGDVGAGLFIPLVAGDTSFSICVKAVRMRTWLLTWGPPAGKIYNGGVVELALPSAHGGPKLGLGAFREAAPTAGVRHSFTYVFVGIGW